MKNPKILVGIALWGLVATLADGLPTSLLLPEKQGTDVVVATNEGSLVGFKSKEAGIFWGIPFSQPPTGEYRWKNPRNPIPYEEKFWDARYKRPGCPQTCYQQAANYSCPHKTDEDCLYLNVFIPEKLLAYVEADAVLNHEHFKIAPQYLDGRHKKLPVLVWFHGGNFVIGAGSCTLYDGRKMASLGDVIVVTTNYRLAHLGFLVQGNSSTNDGKGNFGIWDQIKAMEWVKNNIANFGGDASKVTLFGQSAGAESVGVHLGSKYSDPLFHQAIMQSNPFGLPFRDMKDAQEFGSNFAKACNCNENDMSCLRSKTLLELEKAFKETTSVVTDPSKIMLIFQPWSPVIDGDLLLQQPIDMFMKGSAQKKPMILGSTVDEGMIFVALALRQKISNLAYTALVMAAFKRDGREILKMYPPMCVENDINCDNRVLFNKLATEGLFICPQRIAANASDGTDQWWYIFNQTWSFKEVWEQPLCYDRVCHAAELAYLFNVEELVTYTFTQNEITFGHRLIWYWSNFAKYGNPNGPAEGNTKTLRTEGAAVNARNWKFFNDPTTKQHYTALTLQAEEDFLVNDPYKEICDFWDNLDAYADH